MKHKKLVCFFCSWHEYYIKIQLSSFNAKSNVIQSSKTSKRNQPIAMLSGATQIMVIQSLILLLFKLYSLFHSLSCSFVILKVHSVSNQMYVIEFEDWKKTIKSRHKSTNRTVCNNWIIIKFDYFWCHSNIIFLLGFIHLGYFCFLSKVLMYFSNNLCGTPK